MIAADVQVAFQQLQRVLGLSIVCGQITFNVSDGQLQSVERIREYDRIPTKKIDSAVKSAQSLG